MRTRGISVPYLLVIRKISPRIRKLNATSSYNIDVKQMNHLQNIWILVVVVGSVHFTHLHQKTPLLLEERKSVKGNFN